jgi:hypothetical protein
MQWHLATDDQWSPDHDVTQNLLDLILTFLVLGLKKKDWSDEKSLTCVYLIVRTMLWLKIGVRFMESLHHPQYK